MPLTSAVPARPEILITVDVSAGDEEFALEDASTVDGARARYLKTDSSDNTATFKDGDTVVAIISRQHETALVIAAGGAWHGTQPTRDNVIPIVNDQYGQAVFSTEAVDDAAVNRVHVVNADAGDPVLITAEGDDTNIDVDISGKGTGKATVNGETPAAAPGDTAPSTAGVTDAPTKAVLDAMIATLTTAGVYA